VIDSHDIKIRRTLMPVL